MRGIASFLSLVGKKWHIFERSVRNYCANGRIPGAFRDGRVWKVPSDASKPQKINKKI